MAVWVIVDLDGHGQVCDGVTTVVTGLRHVLDRMLTFPLVGRRESWDWYLLLDYELSQGRPD